MAPHRSVPRAHQEGAAIDDTPPDTGSTDEAVFRALAHPVRRALLDRLRERDGLTLKELAEPLGMTRQGCSKHLAVLEEAHLVIVHEAGREHHHYLNAAPIQTIYDRWVSRFARPWTQLLAHAKARAETPKEPPVHHPDLIVETFVHATPERLWEALTSAEETPKYYMGTRLETELVVGGPYVYRTADGHPMIAGTLESIDPPRELVMTFTPGWCPPEATRTSRVTLTIEPRGPVCKLTVLHQAIALDDAQAGTYREGWTSVLAGLKTLVETGAPMPPPGREG